MRVEKRWFTQSLVIKIHSIQAIFLKYINCFSLLFPQQQSAQSLRFCTQREKNWEWSLELSETKKKCRKWKIKHLWSSRPSYLLMPPSRLLFKYICDTCQHSFEELGQDLNVLEHHTSLCKSEVIAAFGQFHYDSSYKAFSPEFC